MTETLTKPAVASPIPTGPAPPHPAPPRPPEPATAAPAPSFPTPSEATSPLHAAYWTVRRCAWLVGATLSVLWGIAFVGFLYTWPGFDSPLPKNTDPDLVMTELRFLALIAAAGALGATMHAITSFTSHLGNGKFSRAWTPWYLSRAPIGATMALIFMPLVGAGLIPDDVDHPETYAFTLIALAILVGMFSKDASDKLTDIFSAMLSSKRDTERSGKLTVPVPHVGVVEPATLSVGAPVPHVVLSGSGFLPSTTVLCNGAPRRSQTHSPSALSVWLEPEDVAAPGTLTLVPRTLDGDQPVEGTAVSVTVAPQTTKA